MARIPISDTAGVFVRLVDNSQAAPDVLPNGIFGAAVVNSERGFMNRVYRVTSLRARNEFFGKRDWRNYGRSIYDLDKYLESQMPAYVVRAGEGTLAGADFVDTKKPTYILRKVTDKGYVPLSDNDPIEYTTLTTSGVRVTAKDDVILTDVEVGTFDEKFNPEDTDTIDSDGLSLNYADPPTAIKIGQTVYVCASIDKVELTAWKSGGEQTKMLRADLFGDAVCKFFANGEGDWGNDIVIRIIPNKEGDRFTENDGNRFFSVFVYSDLPEIILADEITGDVLDGADIAPTETYSLVSFNANDVDEFGVTTFIEHVMRSSKLVSVVASANGEIDLSDIKVMNETTVRLNGGAVTKKPDSADYLKALDVITKDWDVYDAHIILNAGQGILNTEFDKYVNKFGRSLGITCVEIDEAFNRELPLNGGGVRSKFVAKYNQWVLTRDGENSIYLPATGWIAYLIGEQSRNGQIPYAPAGENRGFLQGAEGVSREWDAGERVECVKHQWNVIKKDSTGYYVWSQVTSQPLRSQFSNIHVMLSTIMMLRGVERTLKGFEFEFNDPTTIATILHMLRSIADDYVAQNYADKITVDDRDNVLGSEQIRIYWGNEYKGVATSIVVDMTAERGVSARIQ